MMSNNSIWIDFYSIIGKNKNFKLCPSLVTFICDNFLFVIQTLALNHRLQTPNEAFFHQNPKLLGLGRQFGQINFWVNGDFRLIYQHPFW